MKAKKKKMRSLVARGFWGRLVDLVAKNFWLKVLSAALAIVIYYSLKPMNFNTPDYDRHAFQPR